MRREQQRRGTVGENQYWQQEIVVHWDVLFRKITTAAAEVKTLFPRKPMWPSQSNIHGRVAIAKPLITENNAQMVKRWCHNHKTWTSHNWKRAYYGLMSRPSRCPLPLENIQGSQQSECLVPTVKHGEVLWRFWKQFSDILVAPLLSFIAELLQGNTWTDE
jgi:hypothetical protein